MSEQQQEQEPNILWPRIAETLGWDEELLRLYRRILLADREREQERERDRGPTAGGGPARAAPRPPAR
jgi:hypothetical protein